MISDLRLEKNIRYLGFLSNQEVYTLYANALALVMPTFLGPTNMPLLEARALGCPVICTNLDGHKELLGEGALYFSPTSVVEISQALKAATDPETRKVLVQKSNEIMKNSIFSKSGALRHFEDGLLELKNVRDCWGNNPI